MHLWKAYGAIALVPVFFAGQQCVGRQIPFVGSAAFCIAYLMVLVCMIVASRKKPYLPIDYLLIVGTAFLLLPWMHRAGKWLY
ncbi:MAG: hypothetical protein V4644_00520 [Patescibacteria group bacterium]